MEQRTSEWFLARKGKFTASEIFNLMASSRRKGEIFGDTALSYIKEKVNECIMNDSVFLSFEELYGYGNQATKWGEYYEDEAREKYSERTGLFVAQTGFIEFGAHTGGSPDGLIPSKNGLIEIKCPFNGAKHIDFMLMKDPADLLEISKQYYYQVQANILFCHASFCDFISYNPRCSDLLSMKILRIYPDDKAIKELKERIELAETRLEHLLSEVTRQGINQFSPFLELT